MVAHESVSNFKDNLNSVVTAKEEDRFEPVRLRRKALKRTNSASMVPNLRSKTLTTKRASAKNL